jgi:hypothetical protein
MGNEIAETEAYRELLWTPLLVSNFGRKYVRVYRKKHKIYHWVRPWMAQLGVLVPLYAAQGKNATAMEWERCKNLTKSDLKFKSPSL